MEDPFVESQTSGWVRVTGVFAEAKQNPGSDECKLGGTFCCSGCQLTIFQIRTENQASANQPWWGFMGDAILAGLCGLEEHVMSPFATRTLAQAWLRPSEVELHPVQQIQDLGL
jgi:hypothetical protein